MPARLFPSGFPASGFTMIELAVTLCIAAILVMLAAPAMSTLIVTQHVRTGASDLNSSLYYARSEALKRATNVEVVPVDNDWKNGWTIRLASDSSVLRARPALNAQVTSMGVTAGTKIVYRSDGHLTAAASPIIFKVSTNGNVDARCVAIDLSGRPNLTIDTDKNPDNGCN